jgi:hypothetical protein
MTRRSRGRALSGEQVERHPHGSSCRQAVLHLGRHAHPRPRSGGIGVTADSELAVALEDVDDGRSNPRGGQILRFQSCGEAVVFVDEPAEQVPPANISRVDRDRLRGLSQRWASGSETPIRSCGEAVVLVDEPSEKIPPANLARVGRDRLSGRGEG